jgi:diaminopimelate epimerase
MHFVKAHTNGNDFIIINSFLPDESAGAILKLCDRRTGIGCDQLVCITKTSAESYALKFFNNDGSIADFCGNGSCAAGLYIRKVLVDYSKVIGIETISLAGANTSSSLHIDEDSVSLSVPRPEIVRATPEYKIIRTGNKHLIADMELIDSHTSIYKDNPDCNVHFIKRVSENTIRMKSFERGSGWTMACGSGAIATAFVAGSPNSMSIVHDGGTSYVQLHEEYISLTVTPRIVFSGEIDLNN